MISELKDMNILFVSCHPDDVEIFAGGTLAKLNKTNKVYVAVVCDGARGGNTEERVRECEESFAKLGLKEDQYVFLFQYNNKLKDNELFKVENDVVYDIENQIKGLGIDVMFTHHPNDYHQDHRVVGTASMAAGRNMRNIIFYSPTYPSGRTQIPVRPNLFVRLTEEDIEMKLKALSMHSSQIKRYGKEDYVDSMKQYARGVALKNSGNYSGWEEEFEINRITL